MPARVQTAADVEGQQRAVERRERRETLERLVLHARGADDLWRAREHYVKYFPELSKERPLPTLERLADWWGAVGQFAVAERFERQRFVVLPLPPPWLDDPERRRELAPLLCADKEARCAAEARAFLLDADERLSSIGRRQQLAADLSDTPNQRGPLLSDAEQIARCGQAARKEPRESGFSTWKRCVTELVPQVVRLPRAAFSLPSHGVLLVARGGYWETCGDAAAFSLATGFAVRRSSCRSASKGRAEVRFDVGWVDAGALRRAALLGAIAPDAVASPAYATSFAVPAGMVANDDESGGLNFAGDIGESDAPWVSFELSGVLQQPLANKLDVHESMKPADELLAQQLSNLPEALAMDCVRDADWADFERLLQAIDPKASVSELFATLKCK